MSATDELRRLLDERGVEYDKAEDDTTIYYDSDGNRYTYNVNRDSGWAQLFGYHMTPEQAIAATLGNGECEMVTSGTPCEGNTDKACTACGAYNIGEFYDGQSHRAAPRYCPNCGKRAKGGL